ncbi:MAG: NAD(P)/FAD-dependent oxidoreductase [Methanotrichaceae archaeon]|nr:NAD(P)/FAD-dependent oxidoreductase [Methanotrichaceae archaeon]
MKSDVVIVGAGPGGSMAAKAAAEAGLNVLLLEKRQEIGEPFRCAEGVSIRSELRQLIKLEPSWISTEVKGVRLYSPNGTNVLITEEGGGEEGGYVLERKTFDRGLATEASKAGAKVLVKTRAVELIKEKGILNGVSAICMGEPLKIKTSLVIGADGVESKVGRWAGIDTASRINNILICVQFLVHDPDVDDDYCEFFFGNNIAPGGYIWIFPKGGKLANIGIGMQGSKSSAGDPLRLLREFMKKRPKAKILQIVTGGIPTSGLMKTTTSDGVMLVGDAAHQSDPLTGGGILNAMRSGIIVGEVAAKAISAGDVSKPGLREYEERWKQCIGKQIEKSYNAKKFFLKLTDDDLNRIASSIQGHDISRLDTQSILKVLLRLNPKLLWNLRYLII